MAADLIQGCKVATGTTLPNQSFKTELGEQTRVARDALTEFVRKFMEGVEALAF